MQVEIKVTDKRVLEWGLPQYGSDHAAALDLRACMNSPVTLNNRECVKISSGVSIFLKDPNYVGLVTPRSGWGSKGLALMNSLGVIDADYQGDIVCFVTNRGERPITINPGDRILQYIALPIARLDLRVVDEFSQETVRGDGGYGSSGNQ